MTETALKVPFFRVDLTSEEINEVVDSLESGWLTTGPKTKRFEEDFARYINVRHSIALNSCTAALHLALEAIGIERGDMVLVPTMTFAATAEVVRYFDATPVFIDCDDTLNIDPAKLRMTIEAIRDGKPVAGLKPPYGALKAVIPMHYGGYCCEMAEIERIADDAGLIIIEDAAHALASAYNHPERGEWIPAGRLGKAACFSFYANKCITTGEGGMVVTDDDALADQMQVMSLHGMSRDVWKRFSKEGSWYIMRLSHRVSNTI